MRALGTVAFVCALSAAMPAPMASGGPTYAWLAYSASTGVMGGAWNYPDIGAAESRAMAECVNHPMHPSDCWSVGGTSNRCISLVIGADRSKFDFGVGNTVAEANEDGLKAAANPPPIAGAVPKGRLCSGSDQPPEQGEAQVIVW